MKKKIILSVVVIVAVLSVAIGGTLAWFTGSASISQNKFEAGTVKIKADDVFAYTDEGLKNWNPGDCTDKEISIEVDGSKRILLRAKITETWKAANGSTIVTTTARNIANVSWSMTEGTVTTTWPNSNWVYNSADGYWYFKGILYPQGYNSTDPHLGNTSNIVASKIKLLSKVCLSGPLTNNTYQGATYTIDVNFEAIQSTNDAELSAWLVNFVPDTGFGANDYGVTGTWNFAP